MKGFLDGLKTTLNVVTALTPIAKAIGGPAVSNLADLAASAASVGRNVLTRVEEGAAVLSEPDAKEAKKIIDALAAVNDGLAAEIAAS